MNRLAQLSEPKELADKLEKIADDFKTSYLVRNGRVMKTNENVKTLRLAVSLLRKEKTNGF